MIAEINTWDISEIYKKDNARILINSIIPSNLKHVSVSVFVYI